MNARPESVVDAIYEAAVDDGRWRDVVRQVAVSSGGFGGALVLFDTTRGTLPVQHDHGFEDGMWRDYGRHYINLDPRIPAWLQKPQAEIYTDAQLGITPHMRRTMEYFDWENRGSDQRFGYGARLFSSPGFESSLFLARSEKQGGAGPADLRKLTYFLPHLRRSITLARRIGRQVSVAALEALSFGVIVLDEGGRVAFANARMHAIAADDDGVQLSSHGLTLAQADEDAAYRRTVEQLRGRRYFEAAARRTALPASRPSGKRPYAILVCPFLRRQSVLPDSGRSLLVCVSDPADTGQFDEALLGALFQLTPAEARLAIGLIRYGTLAAAAADCGVTEGSARQYLKRIYGKTGTQGQADLVGLLMGSVRA